MLNHHVWGCSVLYSTSYTAGIDEMSKEFNSTKVVTTLGLTVYLLGLAVGSMFLAPLSEMYGRKPISVITLFFFVILIIPSALADSIVGMLVVRFFNALAGSAMIATAPGQVSDMVNDEKRALYLSVWSIGPLNGPGMPPPKIEKGGKWTAS
jgi:MFS family permease